MSATMVRQGGRVQLEQSDMRLALNMAKMAKGGFLRAAIEEMQQPIRKPRAEVEEKNRGVEFPAHEKVEAAIERHPSMVLKNHMDGCLPCQNRTAKNPQTCWRRKSTGAPPPEPAAPQHGTLPPPGIPPAPLGDTDGYESYEIVGMPFSFVYIHSPHPNTQCLKYNAYANDCNRDEDFIPYLLSTLSPVRKYCWHWFWRWQ